MSGHSKLVATALLGALLVGAGAMRADACNVPVFRYALERWQPDPYQAIIFHRGGLDASSKQTLQYLEKAAAGVDASPNLEVQTVDLAGPVDKAMQDLWEAQNQKQTQLPWMVVRYPERAGESAVAWSGGVSMSTAQGLLDSPARKQIVRRLLGGHSAVWVLLESGDRAKDDAAAKLLQEQLAQMPQRLTLPEPDPALDPTAEGGLATQPASQPTTQAADTGLHIAFSLLRVSRADPAEQVFVSTLLGTDNDLRAPGAAVEPVAFPVFGRGRALTALAGQALSADRIFECCQFLVGPCACQVKEQNPGVDLLISADWYATGTALVVDVPPPPLTGLPAQSSADLQAPIQPTLAQAGLASVLAPATAPTTSPAVEIHQSPLAEPAAHGSVMVIVLAVTLGALVVLGLAWGMMLRRNPGTR